MMSLTDVQVVELTDQTTETIDCSSGVKEVTLSGAKCTARIISFGDANAATLETKKNGVLRGCERLSQLGHPNVVRFLGTADLPHLSPLPVLLTDYYPTNLHQFLTRSQARLAISLGLKVSIMRNVASGLAYLHSLSPSIIHGHLSAKCIFLDDGAVAKIAVDEGVVVLPQPIKTTPYMPPEVNGVESVLTTSVDLFSLGVLALFTLTHSPPTNLLPPVSEPETKGDCGLEWHAQNMEKLHNELGQDHPLVQMIRQCLDTRPQERPTAKSLVEPHSLLWRAAVMIPDPLQEKSKLDLIGEITSLSRAHVKLRDEAERHYNELRGHIKGLLQGMACQRELIPRKDPTEDIELVIDSDIGYISRFLEGIDAIQLGSTLGVHEHILANTAHDPRWKGNENRKRAEVLRSWMNNADNPTWDSLVHALTCIGQKRMADILSKDKGLDYCTAEPQLPNCDLPQQKVQRTPDLSKPSSNDKESDLRAQLARAQESLKKAQSVLSETRQDQEEINRRCQELEETLSQKDGEIRNLKIELKGEALNSKELANENMGLKIELERLKKK